MNCLIKGFLIKNRVILFILNWSIFSCNSQKFHIKPQYDAVMPFKNGIAAVKVGAYWGFIDTIGQWIFDAKFPEIDYSTHGEYIITTPDDGSVKILLKDNNGKWRLNPYHDAIQEIKTTSGIRIIFKSNNKLAIFDKSRKQLTKDFYDNLVYIGEDLFVGSLQRKGDQLINADGKIVSEFYTEITPEIKFGRIKFKRDKYSGLLDTKGQIVVQPVWWLLEIAGKNIACTHGGDLKLYTDQLVLLSDFEFDVLFFFQNGNWIGRNADTGDSKLFNPDGKVLKNNLKFGYGGIYKGMIPAENNAGLYGYVNEDGKEMIPFQFKYAESFMPSGKAVVWQDDNGRNKGVIIDTQGQQVFSPTFDKIEWHADGIYTMEYGDKNQLLDQNFKPITKLSKNPVEYIGNGVYAQYKTGRSLKVQKSNFYTGDKFKIYRSRDVEIVSFHALDGTLLVKADEMKEGDMVPKVAEGMAIAQNKGKWGFIKLPIKL